MVYCRYCGHKINEWTEICPKCGAYVISSYKNQLSRLHSLPWPIFFAGIFILIVSILFLMAAISKFEILLWNFPHLSNLIYLLLLLVDILGFIFGLRAAYFIFSRRNYYSAFRNSLFVLIIGFVFFLIYPYNLTIIILTILVLVFLSISKKEFIHPSAPPAPPEFYQSRPGAAQTKFNYDAMPLNKQSEKLRILKELLDDGIISEVEFNRKKKELLKQL